MVLVEREYARVDGISSKQDRDFEILVSYQDYKVKKTVEEFPKWYQEQGYKDIPVLYDTKGNSSKPTTIRSIPTEYLIDSQEKLEKINLVLLAMQMLKRLLKK